MAAPSALDLWLYGTHVAVLTRDDRDRIALEWTDAALDRWGATSRVVSNLLPLGEELRPPRVKAFFDGYLPEGTARVHHAVEAGVEAADTFAMVGVYGRDLAGALIAVPAGDSPNPSDPHYEPISLAQVRQRLENASHHTGRLDARDSFASLPGMVPKITLHREGSQWFACRGGAPSTWIIKRGHPEGSPARDVIDTEVLALRCAARIGLGSVQAELLELDGVRAIAVSRYDRRPPSHDRGLGRIHQEDLAQAIGLNTDDPNRKFQRGRSQLPSLRLAAEVLTSSGTDPDSLVALTTFNIALGNTDMHAKNISFLRSPRARAQLAPAYDVSMHLHGGDHSGQFALQINAKSYVEDVAVSDLISEATSWGVPRHRVVESISTTLDNLSTALRTERSEFPHSGVSDLAWSTALKRVSDLQRGMPSSA
ncbi:MAG TPA: HipA domain-containing protein [Nocardioides sp.]|uniref:type II toxin-antitoxin system HipA family toxin n=1 Tax=uncultured Nocardioides sp. TaxID=198441 RepID=UPI0026102FE9|nr:HipA domain-containing protein [uncultured Nocardioides sp.]HRD60238.1 HipA domain-containing protein [Nocardioides sp.]HRI96906.1 HipA domain-containing protein [Nocardioides sp.]HRK48499.1 HipA domain-containing protein [Nocardioides sp.]